MQVSINIEQFSPVYVASHLLKVLRNSSTRATSSSGGSHARHFEPCPRQGVFHQTLRNLAAGQRFDVLTVYAWDETRDELVLIASHGLGEAAIGYRMAVGVGPTGKVARTRKPLAVKHPADHPDFHYVEGAGEEKYYSHLGIPLTNFGRLLGVLVVQTVEAKVFLMSDIEELYKAGQRVMFDLAEDTPPAEQIAVA